MEALANTFGGSNIGVDAGHRAARVFQQLLRHDRTNSSMALWISSAQGPGRTTRKTSNSFSRSSLDIFVNARSCSLPGGRGCSAMYS